jgi:hypothetical protein
MDSLPQPIRSLLLSCSPQRSRKVGGPFQARALCVPAARLSGFFVWTRVGSLRSPGDPSRAFAPLLDPGRTDVSSPCRPHRCCPRFAHSEGFGNCISGLAHAASAPADLRFAFRVATHAQGSLPAGWLAFAGRASNPPDRYERFQLVLTIIPLSCSPDASAMAASGESCRHRRHSSSSVRDPKKTNVVQGCRNALAVVVRASDRRAPSDFGVLKNGSLDGCGLTVHGPHHIAGAVPWCRCSAY